MWVPSGLEDTAKQMYRNHNEVSFKSLLVTNFTIPEMRRVKSKKSKELVANTVHDAKMQVCELLGIDERPYKRSDPQGKGYIPPGCTVTLTHKNMSKLAKDIEDFKQKYRPAFERVLTAYLRRFTKPFGAGHEYDTLWDRIVGNVKVGL